MLKIRTLLAIAAALLAATPLCAQDWPNKTVKVIVPFPPGGGTDTVARPLTAKLSQMLGQQFVIENRGGAGGTIGTAQVAKATPDGYNLTVASTSTHVVAPSVYAKLDYDPVKDFAPVGLMAVSPYLLVVHPSVPAEP